MIIRPSVRPTAPQGPNMRWHALDITLCCIPRFWRVFRMVTRVVAKQAKTTKVKNNFINGNKNCKRILSCLFGGRRKVQFKGKIQVKSSICLRASSVVVSSAANSVGTPLEFSAFHTGLDAKYSRDSAFWFFLSTTVVFAAVQTAFAKKNTIFT